MLIMQVVQIIYLIWSKPYKRRLDNIIEGFNEFCILSSLYMYLMFTLDDYDIKYYAG